MPVSDLSIDYANRLITRPSGTDTFSARAMYSWLQDQIDELTTLTRHNPMTAQTPTDFTLVNGYMIAESVFQYITGGSVSTYGWDAAVFDGTNSKQTFGIYVSTFQSGGYVSAIAGDIGKTVVAGATNGKLLYYDNTLRKWWVRRNTGTSWSGAVTITGGTGAGTLTSAVTGEALYSNVYSLPSGSLEASTQQYIEQNSAVITTYWPVGHIDLIIKVREAGTLIFRSAGLCTESDQIAFTGISL